MHFELETSRVVAVDRPVRQEARVLDASHRSCPRAAVAEVGEGGRRQRFDRTEGIIQSFGQRSPHERHRPLFAQLAVVEELYVESKP